MILGVAVTILLALRFQDRPTVRRAATLGAMCGLLTLIRAEQVLLLGLLVVPLTLLASNVPLRRRLEWLGVALVAGILVISPWAIYNLSRYQQPTLLTTNFGGAIADRELRPRLPRPRDRVLGHSVLPLAAAHRGLEELRDPERARPPARGLLDARLQTAHARPSLPREHLRDLPAVILAREGRTWGVYRPFQQLHLDLVSGAIWVLQAGLFSYWALAALAVGGACAPTPEAHTVGAGELRRRGLHYDRDHLRADPLPGAGGCRTGALGRRGARSTRRPPARAGSSTGRGRRRGGDEAAAAFAPSVRVRAAPLSPEPP